jgi:hypothetical protein
MCRRKDDESEDPKSVKWKEATKKIGWVSMRLARKTRDARLCM